MVGTSIANPHQRCPDPSCDSPSELTQCQVNAVRLTNWWNAYCSRQSGRANADSVNRLPRNSVNRSASVRPIQNGLKEGFLPRWLRYRIEEDHRLFILLTDFSGSDVSLGVSAVAILDSSVNCVCVWSTKKLTLPAYCVAANCNNSQTTPGITMHELPRNRPVVRRKWIKFIQFKRADFLAAPHHAHLCSEHFSECDFANPISVSVPPPCYRSST